MAEEMPSPGTNWEWTSPGTQGLRQEGPALTPEHSMKNHLLQNLAKWLGKLGCASQFELNQSVRNGEINQHNKTSCRQPGGAVALDHLAHWALLALLEALRVCNTRSCGEWLPGMGNTE